MKGQQFEVDNVKYLGVAYTEDGRSTIEIKIRLTMTTSSMAKLNKTWSSKDISFPKIRSHCIKPWYCQSYFYGRHTRADKRKDYQSRDFSSLRDMRRSLDYVPLVLGAANLVSVPVTGLPHMLLTVSFWSSSRLFTFLNDWFSFPTIFFLLGHLTFQNFIKISEY